MRIQCGYSEEEEEVGEEEDCGGTEGVQRGYDVPLLSSLPKGKRKMD